MSYTPESQDLDAPVSKAVEALKEVLAAIDARLDDSRWQAEHLDALEARVPGIRATLSSLRRLARLNQRTNE